MPGELTTAKIAVRDALAAHMPGRIVTRDFRLLSQRSEAELIAGVVSVVGLGEQDYANYRGREADLGRIPLVIVGQLLVPRGVGETEDDHEAVEDAEDAMAEEIKAFLASPPSTVRSVIANGFRQSGQLEAPYGWVVFECEVRP